MRIVLIVILWGAGLLSSAQGADLTPGYWEQTPLPLTGLATFYAAGMMEHVQEVRAAHGQALRCDECVGTVALLRAGDIGRKVWLQPPGGERVGPFLVIDCARREDIPPLLARNWVVDVSYEVGQLWNMDRPLDGVTVLADPADHGRSGWLNGPLLPPTPFYVPPDRVLLSAPTPTPPISPTPWQPTPWPTRWPAPLARTASASVEKPTPAASPLPTPLTPIITTPTPRVTAPLATAVAPGAPAFRPTALLPDDVAVGRAGGRLLALDSLPAVTPTASAVLPRQMSPAPSSTFLSPRGAVTPSVTSPPILPRRASPTPTPRPADSGGLTELLRLLLGFPRP